MQSLHAQLKCRMFTEIKDRDAWRTITGYI